MHLAHATAVLTAATTRAARNWAGNLRALARVQPEIVEQIQALPVQGEWVFARDGSLTLLDNGQWIGGCSLPYRAAVAMLKSLDPRGSVACFLSPTHAAEIRASLERFSAQQAVISIQPDWQTLRIILSCEDFSTELESNRLFFTAGNDWCAAMRSLFAKHPGLPTPQQFIKLPTLASEIAQPLIDESQTTFGEVLNARVERIKSLRDGPRVNYIERTKASPADRKPPRIGLIANSQFTLWDDAGAALAEALHSPASSPTTSLDAEVRALDPDVPIFAGPVAAAEFCRECDAVVTADSARCDFPDVLPLDLPWVTWVTRGRIPLFAAAGPFDALLLTDPAWCGPAIAQDWPANRVSVATFAAIRAGSGDAAHAESKSKFTGWTILANTAVVKMPKSLEDFSSHQLLWESIATELTANPFAVGQDVGEYLRKRARDTGVDELAVDARLFTDTLIVPTFQQATVRALRKANVPVRVFGNGWSEMDEFRSIAAGPIASRAALAEAIASSSRLIHLWPTGHAHPIDASGLPVLRRSLSRLESFVQQARRPDAVAASAPPTQPISLERILSILPGEFQPRNQEPRLY